MEKICYRCLREKPKEERKRVLLENPFPFIADDGRYLCDPCARESGAKEFVPTEAYLKTLEANSPSKGFDIKAII